MTSTFSDRDYQTLCAIAFRVNADLDHIMRSWAIAESSCLFQTSKGRRYRRLCIQEQVYDPRVSPVVQQIATNAWRETVLGLIRMTDCKKDSYTIPKFRMLLLRIGSLEHLANNHIDYKLMKAYNKGHIEQYMKRLKQAHKSIKYKSFSNMKNDTPDNECELFQTIRNNLRNIRNQWLAHSLEAETFLLRNHTKNIRRGLVIVGSLNEDIALLVHGNSTCNKVSFKGHLKKSEALWQMIDNSVFGETDHSAISSIDRE